jgi:hypothetical protein
VVILSPEINTFSPKLIASGILSFSIQNTIGKIVYPSSFCCELNYCLEEAMTLFLSSAAGITDIYDIQPVLELLEKYEEFESRYELPLATKYFPKEQLESHYEDFLAF